MRDRQSVTICRESVVNHEEPKEFEELSRQCVNDHVGKKATHASRMKEHLRFVSVAFGFRCLR